jgi:hypothetical protein
MQVHPNRGAPVAGTSKVGLTRPGKAGLDLDKADLSHQHQTSSYLTR